MARVIWTDPALKNLDEIADYIALENMDAARELVALVFEKIDLLAGAPHLGNIPDELGGTIYRRLVVWLLYVYYRIEGDQVVIIHLRRTERRFSLDAIEESEQ